MTQECEEPRPLSVSTDGKSDLEDEGVVTNEVLDINGEKLGAEEPQEGIPTENAGPTDGGYGWVVVMYLPYPNLGADAVFLCLARLAF
jgi:hypothetical protein